MPVSSGRDVQNYLHRGACSLRGGLLDVARTVASKHPGDASVAAPSNATINRYQLTFESADTGKSKGDTGCSSEGLSSSSSSSSSSISPAVEVVEVDYVVDACGLSADCSDPQRLNVLFKSLLRADMLEPYQFGGFCADPISNRLVLNGVSAQRPVPLIYAVGQALFGVKLATSGLGYVTMHAMSAVDDIMKQLETRSASGGT